VASRRAMAVLVSRVRSAIAEVKTHLNSSAILESTPLLELQQLSEKAGVGITLDKATTGIEGCVPRNVRVGSERDAFGPPSARLALDCFHERAPMSTAHQ
jgi:hypothetical protein